MKLLKNTAFLKSFNFSELLDFKIKAPFVPEQRSWTHMISKQTNLLEDMLAHNNQLDSQNELNVSLEVDPGYRYIDWLSEF